jgi:hypothetical protein
MNYELLLVFVSSPSLVSKLTKWFTKSKWSHIAVTMGRLIGKHVLVSEATWIGVDTNPLVCYNEKDKEIQIYSVPIDSQLMQFGVDECIEAERRGIKYGYGQYVGMAPVTLLERINVHIKNPFKHGRICSEHALICLSRAGYDKFITMVGKKDSLSPADLYNIVSKDGRCRLVATKKVGETSITWRL